MDRPFWRCCSLCGSENQLEQAICAGCERTYGPKVARLLARAERDPDFTAACLANFPVKLRERFAALLSKRCFLPGAGTRSGPGLRATKPRPSAQWLRNVN